MIDQTRLQQGRADPHRPGHGPRDLGLGRAISRQERDPRRSWIEQVSGHRQIGRDVTAGHVAPVNNGANRALAHQDIAGVQVAVNPFRRD